MAKLTSGFKPAYARSCTDVVFLVLFIFFWLGMIAIGSMAFVDGEPERLVYGKDVRGDVCGTEDNKDKPYLWWRESKMVSATRWTDLQAVCVSSCPTAGDVVYSSGEICTKDAGCAVTISTINRLNRCFPTTHHNSWLEGYKVAYDSISGVDFAIFRGMGDSRSSMAAILVCGGLIAFLWAHALVVNWVLTFFVQELLYGYTVASLNALILLLVAFLTRYLIPAGGSGYIDVNLACFIFFCVVTIVFALLVLLSWSWVSVVNAAIQGPGQKLVSRLSGLYGLVAVMSLLMIWFFSYWIDVAAYLSSSETTVSQYAQSLSEFDSMGYDDDEVTVITTVSDGHVTALMWYHFFGLLWTSEFLLCFTVCSIAGAVSEELSLSSSVSSGKWLVCSAVRRTICFNLGSVAFGSFLIVVLWPFRLIGSLFYSVLPSDTTSGIAKVICCCCICTSWCFEQCIKYSNKLAFTVVGESGLSFCAASRVALDRLEVAEFSWYTLAVMPAGGDKLLFSTTVLFIACKLAISICCGFVSWIWVGHMESVESPLFPVLLTIYLGYFCSGIVFQVLQAVLETVFVSDGIYTAWTKK